MTARRRKDTILSVRKQLKDTVEMRQRDAEEFETRLKDDTHSLREEVKRKEEDAKVLKMMLISARNELSAKERASSQLIKRMKEIKSGRRHKARS